nr:hypothetical protein [Tanacetum cinerariifolium]
MVHANVISHNHQESGAPPNKGIIKNPSKLFSPKYQEQSSLGKENGRSYSSKRVHFVNTIIIVRKEDEPKGTKILKSNAIKSENHNFAVEDDKMVKKKSKDYKILVKEEETYYIGNDNNSNDLEDEAFKDKTDIKKEGEWMEYEPPLDLFDVSDESVYESLIERMLSYSLNFDFRTKKEDPSNLKIPCIKGRKFIAKAYI